MKPWLKVMHCACIAVIALFLWILVVAIEHGIRRSVPVESAAFALVSLAVTWLFVRYLLRVPTAAFLNEDGVDLWILWRKSVRVRPGDVAKLQVVISGRTSGHTAFKVQLSNGRRFYIDEDWYDGLPGALSERLGLLR